MSKILKVDQGDYVIQVQPGGNIILDAGLTGKIIFTGGIDISGTSTTINSTNTEIADNIFTLNNGEVGPGISAANNYEAGINIDRGTIASNSSSAQIIFSETEDAYNPLSGSRIAGAFLLRTTSGVTKTLSNLKITTAELRAISNTGANSIEVNLGSTVGVVSLVNSTSTSNLQYHERVTDNSLVNKKYVNVYVVSGVVTTGMADVDKLYKRKLDNSEASKVLATTTALEFSINASNIATIKSDGLSVNNINPYTGNIVTINSVLGLSDQATDPTTIISNKTVIYSKATAGAGSSGIFFKNNINSDELVAKNRALLLSMLF
jgi:hypothetical protein